MLLVTLMRAAGISLLALSSVISSFDGIQRMCRRTTNSRTIRGRMDQHHPIRTISAGSGLAALAAGLPEPERPAPAALAPLTVPFEGFGHASLPLAPLAAPDPQSSRPRFTPARAPPSPSV